VKKLQCTGAKNADCLTADQVDAMKKIYNPLKRKDTGEEIYTGWIVGSEYVEGAGGWQTYWADMKKPEQPMRAEYFRGWVFHDPNWNPWTFDWAKDVDLARKRVGDMADMNDANLSAFKKRGGKIILYQGWADPIVSALDTAAFYGKMDKATGNADFARLFMVPGMGHCANGPGATSFTFAMNSDADHDAVLALERWVEKGQAPEKIIATRYKDRTPASGVAMTRPLCAYPRAPIYSGKGSTDDAANFVCR
jgi:feruloyl esterase